MKFSKILIIIILPVMAISFSFCSLIKDDDKNDGALLTISHMGVDWSEGQTEDVDWEVSDGETIGWCEPGQRNENITGIWYRSFNNKVYRYGAGELSQVQAVEQNRWQSDVCNTPLANGDIWVAECRDGYVKFKVIDQGGINSEWWEVEVEYQFSADGNF